MPRGRPPVRGRPPRPLRFGRRGRMRGAGGRRTMERNMGITPPRSFAARSRLPLARRLGLRFVVPALVWGCWGGPEVPEPAPEPVPAPDPCELLEGVGVSRDAVTVGLVHAIEPGNAPIPVNDSERLFFCQLYETLVQVDCAGAVQSGLAVIWESAEGGRVWRFTVRRSARFWDGSPIDAAGIAGGWKAARKRAFPPDLLEPWRWVSPDSVTSLPDGRIQVALRVAAGSEPRIFAHPALAAAGRTGSSPWPLGSGPFQPIRERAPREGETLFICARNPHHPGPDRGTAELRFRSVPGADPRDLLPDRAEAVLTEDAVAIEYAETLPGFHTTLLPDFRTYFLLSPRFERGDSASMGISSALRKQLATDAFARGAHPAGPGSSCAGAVPPLRAEDRDASVRSRIVYPRGYREAKRIAERLLALARIDASASGPPDLAASPFFETAFRDGREDLTVTELPPADFRASLREGSDAAYVLPVGRSFPDSCLGPAALVTFAPWLHCAAGGCGERSSGGPDPRRVLLALMTTPLHLVHRRELVGVTLAWDGVPRLEHAGMSRTAVVP